MGGPVSAGLSCPACQSDAASVFVANPVDREYFSERAVSASIMRCEHCRSLFQAPWPTDEEVQAFYGPDYQNYTSTSVPLLSHVDAAYQRRQGAAFTRRFGRAARVLDFGCGQGGFLRVLAESGCTGLAGFDFVLYDELVDTPDTRFFDSLDDIRDSGLRFDVIRMRHVIEHLVDVDETMRALGALLEEGGQIIGETPNAAHYTAGLMGQYWGPLHYPYHTVLFSPQGLRGAAPRWELRLTETNGPLLPTGWAMSAENRVKHATGSRARGRTAIYTVLMALSMPMAVMDRILSPRATANFDFVLTRP
jgi:SAM-dependent methyltransferase